MSNFQTKALYRKKAKMAPTSPRPKPLCEPIRAASPVNDGVREVVPVGVAESVGVKVTFCGLVPFCGGVEGTVVSDVTVLLLSPGSEVIAVPLAEDVPTVSAVLVKDAEAVVLVENGQWNGIDVEDPETEDVGPGPW